MKIQVATLNVWALPEPIARDVLPRMRAIGDRLAKSALDVVAFQEVWLPAARDVLVEEGRRHGFAHAWRSSDTLGGGGLLVVSRFPILDSHFEPYTLSGFPEEIENGEYLSGKGFVKLRLQTPNGPFSLIATHLHARYRKDFSHAFRSHRTGQIVQLAEHAREESEPLVMVGDFNVSENGREYRVLTGLTGMRDVGAELGVREPTVYRSNPYRERGAKPDRRIDFIFVRNGAQRAIAPISVCGIFEDEFEIDGRVASCSNHAGVVAELEIRDSQQSSVSPISRRAIDLATEMLAEGRADAESRRTDGRAFSGIGFGVAAMTVVGSRNVDVTRRRFLGGAFRVAGIAATTQVVGYSVMSEYLLPNELSAFREAEKSLQQFARHAPLRDPETLRS
jgi:endonuclease/exonuclease/phosphatase family metal-dependent hydrolase